jgi:serine protease Do
MGGQNMVVLNSRLNKPRRCYLPVLTALVLLFVFASAGPAVAEDVESIKALQQMGKAFARIAEKASPAVVWVTAEKEATQDYSLRMWPFGDRFGDDFFDDFFFNPRYRPRRQPKSRPRQIAQGSGFVIKPDGYILTNNHVIRDAEEVTVKLLDGRKFKAEIIGADPDSEVAVIKIDTSDLPYLELADSDALEVGEFVLAIGSPFGLSHTVTAGIVSAKGRSVGLAEYEDFIQTDAAINPGNSGGPLLNLNGKAVGINTAIIGSNRFIGIGLAIPINLAKNVYEQLIDTGTVTRGVLGVYIKELEPDLAKSLDLKRDTKGVVISEVMEGSAAEKAGLKPYDVVVEFEGEKVEKANEFRNRVSMLKPGTKVKLTVLREGDKRDFTVKLGEKSTLRAGAEPSKILEQLGFAVQNLTEELAERLGYEGQSGVVVTQVEPGSIADRNGIKPGSLIMEVDRKPVKNVKEFSSALEKAGKEGSLLLLVDSGRYRLLVVLPLPEK